MMRIKKTLLSRSPPVGSANWVILFLMLFVVFSMLYWQQTPFLSLLSASREQVIFQNEYWRLFSTLLVHDDFAHLASNSMFFFIFGYLLNGYFGGFVFPLLSLLLGGLVNGLVLAVYPAHSVILGASGMVYAMAGFWLALYCFIDRTQSVKMRIVKSVGVLLVLLFPQEFQPHVSYLAHAIGFLTGALSGSFYFLIYKVQMRKAEVLEEEPIEEQAQELLEESLEVESPKGLAEKLPERLQRHSACL